MISLEGIGVEVGVVLMVGVEVTFRLGVVVGVGVIFLVGVGEDEAILAVDEATGVMVILLVGVTVGVTFLEGRGLGVFTEISLPEEKNERLSKLKMKNIPIIDKINKIMDKRRYLIFFESIY